MRTNTKLRTLCYVTDSCKISGPVEPVSKMKEGSGRVSGMSGQWRLASTPGTPLLDHKYINYSSVSRHSLSGAQEL